MPHIATPTKQNKLNRFDSPAVLPPSPPTSIETVPSQAVLELLEFLRSRREGYVPPAWDKPWNEIPLSLEEYDEFETLLRNDKDELWAYVDDKVRYDWDSRRRIVTIRMPTKTHELFLAQLASEIEIQRHIIARRATGLVATIARQIYLSLSADVFLWDTQKDHRSPDLQWLYMEDGGPPPVVIEASYTQKRKNLSRLADDYIVGSRGSIRMVVGIDIDYRGTKEARIIIWRREVIIDGQETYLKSKQASNEIFRDAQGATNPGNLIFRLEDFASLRSVQNASEEEKATPIAISHDLLTTYLNKAEASHQNDIEDRKNKTDRSEGLPPGIKMRPRPDTPPEEIAAADEAEFVELEAAAERRRSDEDGNFDGVGGNSGVIRRSPRNAPP